MYRRRSSDYFCHLCLGGWVQTVLLLCMCSVLCVGEGLFRLPVFTKQFCHLLLDELDAIEKSDCPKGRPNSMNKSGVSL